MLVLRVRHLVVALVVVLALFLFAADGLHPARAAMGNRGVPVRCFASGGGIAAGDSAFMTCYAADGTSFSGNQRVPSGYYLLVTDVIVTPRAGSNTSGVTEIFVYDAYGASSRQSHFYLRGSTTDSYGHTFAVPYMVLSADHRLEIVAQGFNAYAVDVRATGLLVTNVLAMPLVTSD
jgi:hypothetical protein